MGGPVEACSAYATDCIADVHQLRMVGACGIPAITLEGDAEDWSKLRAKVEHLAGLDLDWWPPSVRAICDQFRRAATSPLAFWRDLCKQREVCGADVNR